MTMKAALLTTAGVPVYADAPVPVAMDDAVPVDVILAGMNPIDMLLATQEGAGFPRVPGSEGVGTVDGKRVYFSALPPHGSMAEKALARPDRIYPVPDGISDELAVALGIGGLTALLSLRERALLEKGETVMVLGASGIVGQFAVQLAKLMGAGRVVAAARNTEAVRNFGADAVVDLTGEDDAAALADKMRAACDGRLDVIIDLIWGVPALAALMAGTQNGRLVQLGHSAAPSVSLAPAFMRGKVVSVLGYSSSAASAATRAAAYADLCAMALAGQISVPTKTVGLSGIDTIWSAQGQSPNVKLCIDPKS